MTAGAFLAACDGPFVPWIAERIGLSARKFRIGEISRPDSGGWSNETIFFSIIPDKGSAAKKRRLVIKLAPAGPSMFRDYDLSREYVCLETLHRLGTVPVPIVVGADWTGAVLARPFYVMERIDGDVPSDDRPSFMEAGWLHDAAPEKQRVFYDDCLAALTRLHKVDPVAAGLGGLQRGGRRSTHLGRELSWLQNLFLWGRGAAPQPIIERAFEHAWATMPGMVDGALLWGDARPANIIVKDFRIAALLDWELATLGPPELDLFWFLEMNRMRSRGRPLPGFRSDEDTIALYENARGVAVRAPGFFRHFSVLKMAVLMLRHLQVRVASGDLPMDHPVLTDNTSLRRLSDLYGTAKAVAS